MSRPERIPMGILKCRIGRRFYPLLDSNADSFEIQATVIYPIRDSDCLSTLEEISRTKTAFLQQRYRLAFHRLLPSQKIQSKRYGFQGKVASLRPNHLERFPLTLQQEEKHPKAVAFESGNRPLRVGQQF